MPKSVRWAALSLSLLLLGTSAQDGEPCNPSGLRKEGYLHNDVKHLIPGVFQKSAQYVFSLFSQMRISIIKIFYSKAVLVSCLPA